MSARFPVWLLDRLATTTLRSLGRTWRYRDPRTGAPPDPRLPPAVYVLWHESIAALCYLHRGQGAAVLASRNRDGEILARGLRRLGFIPVRGSTSRGGREGLAAVLREAKKGRAVAVTPDGPRGPSRSVAPGVIAAAARSDLPVVPVGVAAARAWRLNSWDQFLIPRPGATVWVSRGDPIPVPPDALERRETWQDRIRAALEAERLRCEARATRSDAVGDTPRPGAASRARAGGEARVRRVWTRPPGATLRMGSALFAVGAELRNFAYDVGLGAARRAPLPVISVGGLTVGGSGKTPVAAALATWLADAGHRPAVLTHGFPDEIWLHRRREAAPIVIGDRDRLRGARAARQAGASVAVLDDGFQHRKLHRDLDIVLLDIDALVRTNGWRLPAGPFREGAAALYRADALVLTSRGGPDAASTEAVLEEWLQRRHRTVPHARLRIGSGPIRAANEAASKLGTAAPAVCLTGIMKPNLFFAQARAAVPGIQRFHAMPDHAVPDAASQERLRTAAVPGGFLCTWKDVPRLRGLATDLPLWAIDEQLVWETGEDLLRHLVLAAAG